MCDVSKVWGGGGGSTEKRAYETFLVDQIDM